MGGLEGGVEDPAVSGREVGGQDNGQRLGDRSFFVDARTKKTAPRQKKEGSEEDERKALRTFLEGEQGRRPPWQRSPTIHPSEWQPADRSELYPSHATGNGNSRAET